MTMLQNNINGWPTENQYQVYLNQVYLNTFGLKL